MGAGVPVAVHPAAGRTVEVPAWPGPTAERFAYPTFAAALAAPPRPGAEGLVLHGPRLDERIKLKQADYVTLHRLIFGLTTRRVWERLAVAAAGRETTDARETARTLRLDPVDAAAIPDTGAVWWHDVRAPLPEEFAGWLDDTAAPAGDLSRGLVFAALDGKPLVTRAWAAIRPEQERPLLQRGEDVA